MKNKKKKGFTLIELIAVIAILGILAAVLVPNITGYTDKAKKSKFQSSAKVIVNAISVHNADATTQIDMASTSVKVSDAVGTINTANAGTIDTGNIPSELNTLSLSDVVKVANGNLTVTKGVFVGPATTTTTNTNTNTTGTN